VFPRKPKKEGKGCKEHDRFHNSPPAGRSVKRPTAIFSRLSSSFESMQAFPALLSIIIDDSLASPRQVAGLLGGWSRR
jgi:hypothetical protein